MIPAIAAMSLAASSLAGCASEPPGAAFDSKDPSARIAAIQQAAESRDRAAVPRLINLLESDDPAERLLSIHALEGITGQTLGYDHAAPREERRIAVQRWADWYSKSGGTHGA